MGKGLNRASIIGNLGADPDTRDANGTAVCNMRVATNESYKDKDGEWQDRTEWHNVVAWGRLAEICGQYLKKGSQAYFEGSLQTRSYDDKEGVTKYVTEIKLREMMLLSDRGADAPAPAGKKPAAKQAAATIPQDDGLPF